MRLINTIEVTLLAYSFNEYLDGQYTWLDYKINILGLLFKIYSQPTEI